jgi:hypothetical protein
MCLLGKLSEQPREGQTMAAKQRLGLRQVRALKPGEITRDPTLPGFGARRQRSEEVSYVLFWDEAQRLLGRVANKADPAAEIESGAERSSYF